MRVCLVAFAVLAFCQAEKQSRWNARDLFLQGSTRAETPSGRSTLASQTQVLGLRYSVRRLTQAGQFSEVDPATVFNSGDMIRITVEANDDARLYMVHKGSSGRWTMLFPTLRAAGGVRVVLRGVRYDVPSAEEQAFTFKPPAGKESVFLLLSRKPLFALEQYIEQPEAPTPPSLNGKPNFIIAGQGKINPAVLDDLRKSVRTRDIVVTSVSESTASETAVYIANTSTAETDYLIADFTLEHR